MTSKEFWQSASKKLKYLLIKKEIRSFRRMCDEISISYSLWNQILSGKKSCKLSMLKRVCEHLGTNLYDFFKDLSVSSDIEPVEQFDINVMELKKISNMQQKSLAELIKEINLEGVKVEKKKHK